MNAIDTIHAKAQAKIDADLLEMKRFLESTEAYAADARKLTGRMLSWYTHKRKAQLLWEMMNKCVDLTDTGFMASLLSFVSNAILDDSTFHLEWRKPRFDPNGGLFWLPGGDFETVLSTKEDPDTRPIVLWATDDFGSQKVELIMEAMDIFEERENERYRRIEREMNGDDE